MGCILRVAHGECLGGGVSGTVGDSVVTTQVTGMTVDDEDSSPEGQAAGPTL